MTPIEERLLERKMTEIEQARSWSPRVISKFEALIRGGNDRSLYRANPRAFARDRAIAEGQSIDLFLHATRAGLFEMHWDVLCPQSGCPRHREAVRLRRLVRRPRAQSCAALPASACQRPGVG